MKKVKETTLTLFPNSIGMGYVICDNPQTIHDYGILKVLPLTKRKHLKRLRPYLEYFQPEKLVIREIEPDSAKMSDRIRNLIQAIRKEAEENNIKVSAYCRQDIQNTFLQYARPTKHNINSIISKWYPDLEDRQPERRTNTKNEHYQSGLFDAFSLMLTHFHENFIR